MKSVGETDNRYAVVASGLTATATLPSAAGVTRAAGSQTFADALLEHHPRAAARDPGQLERASVLDRRSRCDEASTPTRNQVERRPSLVRTWSAGTTDSPLLPTSVICSTRFDGLTVTRTSSSRPEP